MKDLRMFHRGVHFQWVQQWHRIRQPVGPRRYPRSPHQEPGTENVLSTLQAAWQFLIIYYFFFSIMNKLHKLIFLIIFWRYPVLKVDTEWINKHRWSLQEVCHVSHWKHKTWFTWSNAARLYSKFGRFWNRLRKL